MDGEEGILLASWPDAQANKWTLVIGVGPMFGWMVWALRPPIPLFGHAWSLTNSPQMLLIAMQQAGSGLSINISPSPRQTGTGVYMCTGRGAR